MVQQPIHKYDYGVENRPRSSSLNAWVEAIVCLLIYFFIVSCITRPIAFGSGAMLRDLTGINFDAIDWVITILMGPLTILIYLYCEHLFVRGPEDRRIRAAFKKRGQIKLWPGIARELSVGSGTLFVELFSFGPTHGIQWRVYWTTEDVTKLMPDQSRPETCECEKGEYPLVDWCFERYLDPKNGIGFLTKAKVDPPNEEFIVPEPPDCLAVPFQTLFPKARIVVLPIVITDPAWIERCRSRRAKKQMI